MERLVIENITYAFETTIKIAEKEYVYPVNYLRYPRQKQSAARNVR